MYEELASGEIWNEYIKVYKQAQRIQQDLVSPSAKLTEESFSEGLQKICENLGLSLRLLSLYRARCPSFDERSYQEELQAIRYFFPIENRAYYLDICRSFYNQAQMSHAEKSFEDRFSKEYKQAEKNYTICIELAAMLLGQDALCDGENYRFLADAYFNRSSIYRGADDVEKALRDLESAKATYKKIPDPGEVSITQEGIDALREILIKRGAQEGFLTSRQLDLSENAKPVVGVKRPASSELEVIPMPDEQRGAELVSLNLFRNLLRWSKTMSPTTALSGSRSSTPSITSWAESHSPAPSSTSCGSPQSSSLWIKKKWLRCYEAESAPSDSEKQSVISAPRQKTGK